MTEMNTQLNLEEYKKKVEDCLKKNYNYTTKEIKATLMNPKELWEQLMQDFSPEMAAQYLDSGL